MRALARIVTVLLVIGCLAINIGNAQAQQSYLLVCRGGGDLHFTYTPFSNFSPNPQIWIRFDAGSEGVGSGWDNLDSLDPGYCSWLDRGLRSGEPDRILIMEPILENDDFSIQWMSGEVMGISSSLYFINGLQNSNHYQSFRVYNDREGNLVVTEIDEGTYALNAPQHISPPDEEEFSHYPRNTTLRWQAVDHAQSYTVEVDCYQCCRSNWWCDEFDDVWLTETGITGTTFEFSFVGAQPGRWRVWAVYANGHEGAKSQWSVFYYDR